MGNTSIYPLIRTELPRYYGGLHYLEGEALASNGVGYFEFYSRLFYIDPNSGKIQQVSADSGGHPWGYIRHLHLS